MTPVRCCMAGCRALGKFFEPDGAWWFCSPCFDIHLALRREEFAQNEPPPRRRLDGRTARALPCGTHAAYERHRRRSETPCSDCVTGEREYQRARYARRQAS